MAVDPVNPNEKIINMHDPARKLYQNRLYGQEAKQGDGSGSDKVSVSLHKAASTMDKLGTVNNEKNLVAKNIREIDSTLQGVTTVIDRMKLQLEKVVKNFPPFSQDSEERKEILMSYISLRQEIIKMTVPAPPEPIYEKHKTLWEKLGYQENGKLTNSVPEISVASTDAQVKRALAGLEGFQSSVTAGRDQLARAVSE